MQNAIAVDTNLLTNSPEQILIADEASDIELEESSKTPTVGILSDFWVYPKFILSQFFIHRSGGITCAISLPQKFVHLN